MRMCVSVSCGGEGVGPDVWESFRFRSRLRMNFLPPRDCSIADDTSVVEQHLLFFHLLLTPLLIITPGDLPSTSSGTSPSLTAAAVPHLRQLSPASNDQSPAKGKKKFPSSPYTSRNTIVPINCALKPTKVATPFPSPNNATPNTHPQLQRKRTFLHHHLDRRRPLRSSHRPSLPHPRCKCRCEMDQRDN